MRQAFFARVIACACGTLAFVGGAAARPEQRAAAPVFAVPANLPVAVAGAKYTYSFCQPVAATANGVCGSLKTPSRNPRGGYGPPYVFQLKFGSGFLPTGLTLSNRTGILTGTVSTAIATDRDYPFTVCAASNRGNGDNCQKTKIHVNAAPAPPPPPPPPKGFAGDWVGTYTRTYFEGLFGCKNIMVQGDSTATLAKHGDAYDLTIHFVNEGFEADRTCAVTKRTDPGNDFGTLALATEKTLAGNIGRLGFALTLTDENTIIGTALDTSTDKYEFTLHRKA
jgi:hypothetical protein